MRFNIKDIILSFISAVAIVVSISGYNVEAAGNNLIPAGNKTTLNVLDISKMYGLKTGQKLYYSSTANKNYNDSNFTKSPQPVSDIINKALLANKGKNVNLFIPAGEYLLDKPLILQDGVTLSGVTGETKLIADDSFKTNLDDYIVSNAKGANVSINGLYIEYRSHKNPVFSNYAVNPNGMEGIILKLKGVTSANIKNSSFIVKNNGIKTTCTPIWVRDGYKNIDISNCYIENTSGGPVGGCLWFMCNNGLVGDTVNVYNNTLVKNGNDEAIAIWGDNKGVHRNYNIYNNTINYTKGVINTSCDKLITVFTGTDDIFNNIKISSNRLNLSGTVRRIMMTEINQGTFANVVFEKNTIKDSVGDATGCTLLTVFEMWSKQGAGESIDSVYNRGDVSFNYNSYTNNTTSGRRCFYSAETSAVKLKGNVINSNFVYGVFFEEATNAKIISSGNEYNYLKTGKTIFATVRGANATACFTGDKIGSKSTEPGTSSKLTYTNCIIQ